MKMKKIFLLALVVLTSIASSCKYDDAEIWESVDNLTDRVVALEELTKQLNGDITAMQSIVTALQKNVSVAKLEEVADGYIIHFTDGTKATIKHGKDGADGEDGADGKDGADGANGKDGADGKDGENGKDGANAPIIGVKAEGDIYYWTITTDGVTDWLTDDEGNKFPVTGIGGADGADGLNGKDGYSPEIKIENGTWWIKNANGSWENTGNTATPVNGEKGDPGKFGDSFFAETNAVKQVGNVIVFTLKNGSTFQVPMAAAFTYTDEDGTIYEGGVITLSANVEYKLKYEVNLDDFSVEILSASNVEYRLVESEKNLIVDGQAGGKMVVLYFDANQTVTSVIKFE